ncbi:HAMP domain-containing protein [Shimia sp. R11_0]|uniref:methyl-accepting chemotaxis protein n=1 Tax=Shimia sp. R11_0 TaxID=2821096 RepID=UPI001ADAD045|nr:methyl-accepting chemotaxis protein [Shimia sp. R11_0]MBO9479464.1 HAMP domain-containing protein [Shimia sp. R11_0]
MRNLLSMRLSKKLPLSIVVFCTLSAAAISVASLLGLRSYAFTAVEQQMEAMVSDRRSAVVQMMLGIEADVMTLAASPATGDALQKFGQSWRELGGAAQADLTAAYVADNPNPVGSKHLLERGAGDAWYHVNHATYHPALRVMIETKGYYDAFLIGAQGDIVYSVFKEADFATNLFKGAYHDSGLAEVFLAALDGEPGQVYFSDMRAYAPSNGAAAAFVASQVVDLGGAPLGVVALQIPVALLGDIVNNPQGLGGTTQIYLVGDDGLARTTARFDGGYSVLQEMRNLPHVDAALAGAQTFEKNAVGVGGQDVVTYAAPVGLTHANWAIAAEQDLSETMAPVQRTTQIFILISCVVAAIMSGLGWVMARVITVPLNSICGDMDRISAGEYDAEVVAAQRGDEIGDLGKTLLSMRSDLKKARALEEARAQAAEAQACVVESLSAGLVQLSEGDFSRTIDEAFDPDHEMLRSHFNTTVSRLNDTVSRVVTAASSIQQGSAEISQSSLDLAGRTENQAATLEETAAALEEMTSNVKAAADGARTVEQVVTDAKREAEQSDEVVREAVSAMTEIEQSSQQIAQIITVIEDIAFQTNLLALNAGVEAARAGSAGRGFAVVASEVRALAHRSSDAVMEIRDLIGNSSKQVENGVLLVDRAGDSLSNIAERVGHISKLVSEIAQSASDQSSGLVEINTNVVQLDQVTQANAAMVEECSAAGQMLSQDANELNNMVAQFKVAEPAGRKKSPVTKAGQSHPASTAQAPVAAPKEASAPLATRAQDAAMAEGNAAVNLWQDF